MGSWLIVALLWLGFGGSHVLLGREPIRARLVRSLGGDGFLALFVVVSSATFAALVVTYARLPDEAVGPDFGRIPALRWALLASLVSGMVLMTAGLLGYPRLPVLTRGEGDWAPITKITRHPFFVGLVLFGSAHALLSTRPASAVFWLGFVVLAALGIRTQDRRLARDADYRAVLEHTSVIPFGAVLDGRQRLRWSEVPWTHGLFGLVTAYVLRAVHPHLMAWSGLAFLGPFLVVTTLLSISLRHRLRM